MKTLDYLINSVDSVPLNISWYLADLGEAKGHLASIRDSLNRRG